jgi:hypothetical protein
MICEAHKPVIFAKPLSRLQSDCIVGQCSCHRAEVAADPDIGAVLSELVETSAGHEIYLRRPEHLGLDMRKPATFETVLHCCLAPRQE